MRQAKHQVQAWRRLAAFCLIAGASIQAQAQTQVAGQSVAQSSSASSHRYRGGVNLNERLQQSADQRFVLNANLLPTSNAQERKPSEHAQAPVTKTVAQSGGRFALSASLSDPRATLACDAAPADNIFLNGFEP